MNNKLTNKQKQDKTKPKTSIEDNPYTNSKINQETDYFVTNTDMEINKGCKC